MNILTIYLVGWLIAVALLTWAELDDRKRGIPITVRDVLICLVASLTSWFIVFLAAWVELESLWKRFNVSKNWDKLMNKRLL